MKKIALFLALTLVFLCTACAEQNPAESTQEPVVLEGVVLEISEEGLLIETEAQGEVLVLQDDDTVSDTDADIAVGDYIIIDYDGAMTKSLPPQVTADVVRMHKLTGEISEVYADENALLLNDPEKGEVYVHLPESWKEAEIDFPNVIVYFNGAMTMSLPGQISASYIVPVYSMQDAVTEIGDGYIVIGEEENAVQVNCTAEQLPENLEIGAVVRVLYNGQTTRSVPPQITAMELIQISR